jgi:hypothetical protein
MRPLALFALLAALCSAPIRAENDHAAPAPGPGKDLVAAACGGGLLVQPADTGKPGAADEGFDSATDDAVSDLTDSSDTAGDDGKKKPAKKAAPKKKPRTRLIRPRSEKDKAACPGKFKEFYEKYGDRLTGVPAPENVPTEQIEANIDRVFGLAAGAGTKKSLAALKDGDLAAKGAFVARLFDGVKTLDPGAFETVTKRSHDVAAAKSEGVMNGELGGTPEEAAAAKAAKSAAEAKREPLDTRADSPLSPLQRQRFGTPSAPPDLGDGGYRPPPVGTYVPAGPPAQSSYNRYVPNFIQDAATGAGSWLADKVYGGGNPAINVEMPADTQSPERWRRVRFGNYGTDAMIKGLVAVGADMGKMNAPTLQIGDISQKGGGTFRRHLSHKVGKDVDIFFITDKRGNFDVPWNLTLAATAVKDMNVTHIFVDTPLKNYMTQYLNAHPEIPAPEREHMAKALSRMSYWPGHDTHFHIRIDY